MNVKTSLVETHIIFISESKVEYLLLKRAENEKYPNIWQMVTGKVKYNETAYHAAKREIKEETGLDIEKLYIVPKVNSFYNSDDDSINFIPVFVAVVKSQKVLLSKEHQSFQWVEKSKAVKLLAWPGQSDSVDIIDEFFSGKNKSLNFIEIDINRN